jgi:tetratricopeptide (TPR) repeat protein
MNLYHLGLLAFGTGDNNAALEYGQQALLVLKKLDLRPEQTGPLIVLSYAQLSLGQLAEAAESFRQTLDVSRALNLNHIALFALAGQALVCLTQGDVPQALVKVEEILAHLDSDDFQLASLEEPFGIYVICYRVLQASGDPRARDVLHTAHGLLQERAAKISDEKMRRSFLENVPPHREILSEFAERT